MEAEVLCLARRWGRDEKKEMGTAISKRVLPVGDGAIDDRELPHYGLPQLQIFVLIMLLVLYLLILLY